ncbi:MAG: response regulator [Coleofasciculus sp. G1-WW12-02]|uniref:response regulator n=1 Tax=Coleofasciculus sp. G1-WW12-02 TaxID=3068483 RepID=UPI0032F7F410
MNHSFKNKRILVVDYNTDSRELLSVIFEQEQAQVLSVTGAREALEVYEDFQPDILLCELLLPGEDGYWLIRQIRSLEAKRGRQSSAIAVTVAATDQDRQLALAAGFHSHIAKPLKVDDLLAIAAIVEDSQRCPQLAQ